MLVTAHVLMTTDLGREDEAIKAVMGNSKVVDARRVFGAFDTVARIQADSEKELKAVIEQLRQIEGVRSTMTLRDVQPEEL